MSPVPDSVTIEDLTTSTPRTFPVDMSFQPLRREAYHRQSIPTQRQSVNMTNIVGEGTLDTSGLWRREQVDFSMGAGQQYLDRKGSQENRVFRSKGVDIFTFPKQATLLPDVANQVGGITAQSDIQTARCGDYIIVANHNTVYRYDESWNQLTFGVDTTFGGISYGTTYDITTNDEYVYIATSTGIWFSDPSKLSGGNPYFQLYAAPDVSTNYGGGYGMVSWANDQIIASSFQSLGLGQFGNRLYAFQPRSATLFPQFGGVPSVGTSNLSIKFISTPTNGISTTATVRTVKPHNLEVGQSITIENSRTTSAITSLSLSGGYVSVVTATSHGLSEGETITMRLQYTNGHVINETATVSTVTAYNTFSYAAQKVSTITGFSTGTVEGSDTYGFNATFNVTTVPSFSPLSITTSDVLFSSPLGFVVVGVIYGTAAAHNLSVGETVIVSGMTPAEYNDTFIVQYIVDSTHFIVFRPSSNTPALGATPEVVRAMLDFTISVPPESAQLARGGYVVNSNPPDLLYEHPSQYYVWSGATGGETQVYIGGYYKTPTGIPHNGCIYRSSLLGSSTTSQTGVLTVSSSKATQPWVLDTPVQALPMSPDEYPSCLQSYLNYIFIGTNRGIRMCQTLSIYDPTATATGDLKSGPLSPNILQPVGEPVTAICGDGRYVWFAWSNYDSVSTGLGRLDLSTFIAGDPLAPAYASDLMVTGQGIINSIDWHPQGNYPIFAVASKGVYAPFANNVGGNIRATTFVPSGYIESSYFDYGISDKKIPMQFDYGGIATHGSKLSAAVTLDPLDSAATQTITAPDYVIADPTLFNLSATSPPYTKAAQFQVKVTLTAGTNLATQDTSPILTRWTLRSWPAIVAGTRVMCVINNGGGVQIDGGDYWHDPYDNFIWLENLRQSQSMVLYTEGALSVIGTIIELDDHPEQDNGNYEGGYTGPMVITINTLLPFVYTPPATS